MALSSRGGGGKALMAISGGTTFFCGFPKGARKKIAFFADASAKGGGVDPPLKKFLKQKNMQKYVSFTTNAFLSFKIIHIRPLFFSTYVFIHVYPLYSLRRRAGFCLTRMMYIYPLSEKILYLIF